MFIKQLAESGILAILVAIAGWIFVYKNSRVLARQGEINTLTSSVEKTLQEISDENYKFWRDADGSDKDHEVKCRLFQAYIEFRCNFIEEKVAFLNGKCKSVWRLDIDHADFEERTIDLISRIRDKSTFNSENPGLVSDKASRVMQTNAAAMKLFSEIHEFIKERYRPFDDQEFEW